MENTRKMFEYAMMMEQQGEHFYLKNQNKLDYAPCRATFGRLAVIKKHQYALLHEAYGLFSRNGNLEKSEVETLETRSRIEAMLQEEQTLLEPAVDQSLQDIAIIRMAYLVENDLTEFYQKASQRTIVAGAKFLFTLLASWEEIQRAIFAQTYHELTDSICGNQAGTNTP